MKEGYVYILASQKNGTIYIGVTSDLCKRIYEHKTGVSPGFTSRYNVKTLVYYECVPSIISAIAREKQLKRWKREWKLALIEKSNPHWEDLYAEILL